MFSALRQQFCVSKLYYRAAGLKTKQERCEPFSQTREIRSTFLCSCVCAVKVIYEHNTSWAPGPSFLWKGRLSWLTKDLNGPKHKHCCYVTNSHIYFLPGIINNDLWSVLYFVTSIFLCIRSEGGIKQHTHTKSVGTSILRKRELNISPSDDSDSSVVVYPSLCVLSVTQALHRGTSQPG